MKLETKSMVRGLPISEELWEDIELGNLIWNASIALKVRELVGEVDQRMMGDDDDRD